MSHPAAIRESPAEAPPPYAARAVGRIYRKSLAGPVIFFVFVAGAWAAVCAAAFFRDLGDKGETSHLKTADIVLGALATVITGIYVFGFVAICMKRLQLIGIFSKLSLVAAVLGFAASILQLVFHVTMKKDWQAQCRVLNQDEYADAGVDVDDSELADYCQSRWKREIYAQVGWIIFLTIATGFLYAVSLAYYHQERNPQLTRTAPSTAYRMNPYGQDAPFVAPGHMQYDAAQTPMGAPPPDYKRQSDSAFAPPAYPPPGQGGFADMGPEKDRDAMEEDHADLGSGQPQQERRDGHIV